MMSCLNRDSHHMDGPQLHGLGLQFVARVLLCCVAADLKRTTGILVSWPAVI